MKGRKITALAVVMMMVALGGGLAMLDTDTEAYTKSTVPNTQIPQYNVKVGEQIDIMVGAPLVIEGGYLRYDGNLFPGFRYGGLGLEYSNVRINTAQNYIAADLSGTVSCPGTFEVGIRMVNNPQQHTFVEVARVVSEATEDYPCAYFEDKYQWLSCPKGGTVTAPMFNGQSVKWTCDGVTYQSGDEIPLVAAQSTFTMSGYTPLLKFTSSPKYDGSFSYV